MRIEGLLCFLAIALISFCSYNSNGQNIQWKLWNSNDCGGSVRTDQETRFIFKYPNARNQPGTWPWLVSMGKMSSTNVWEHNCGGSLVTPQHVLTAAHCPIDLRSEIAQDQIFIRAGDSHLQDTIDDRGVQVIQVSNFTVHPDFNWTVRYSDIGVLQLLNPVILTDLVRPICLPSHPTFRHQEDNDLLVVTGWGANVGSQAGTALRDAHVQVYPEEYFNLTHIGESRNRVAAPNGFSSDLFCGGDIAGSEGVCEGDSGSPAVSFQPLDKKFVLKGVVSGGLSCGTYKHPNIYVRVSDAEILTWIIFQIKNEPLDETNNNDKTSEDTINIESRSEIECEIIGCTAGFDSELCPRCAEGEDLVDDLFDDDTNICMTTPSRPGLYGNPSKGEAKCVFPFLYKGVKYTSCAYGNVTSSLAQEARWCSTKVDKGGKHVRGQGEWGYCSQECNSPKSSTNDCDIFDDCDYDYDYDYDYEF